MITADNLLKRIENLMGGDNKETYESIKIKALIAILAQLEKSSKLTQNKE